MSQTEATYRMLDVTIRYVRDGKVLERVIDVGKAGGILWDDRALQAVPHVARGADRLPAGPPTPGPERKPAASAASAMGTFCWWDPLEHAWKCAPGPE